MNERPHILIIEDDPFYREFLSRALDKTYQTETADDGLEALSKLSLYTYDLILCDLRLPGISARELIQRVRELSDEESVLVIITGFEQDLSPMEATDAYVFSYLKKGQFSPKELRRVVQNGLALRKERQQKKKVAESLRDSNLMLEEKVSEGSKALYESEDKYRNLFEQSLVGIYIQQENRIRLANERLCEILDSPMQTLLEKSIEDFIEPVSLDGPSFVPDSRPGNRRDAMQEIKMKTRGGDVRSGLHCAGTIRFQGTLATQGCILDITDWKVLEQQVLQHQKMESLGTLISGITHEFNNILGAILPQTEMLLHHAKQIPSIQRPAEILFTMAEKASRLTRQLLNMSRKAAMERHAVEVNTWLRESLSFLATTLGSSIQVKLEFDPASGRIEADPNHLDQILMNLVINARDAMSDGGTIRIASSPCAMETQSGNPNEEDEPSFVEITVEDTGCGIPSENLSKVFDPFFTTKETGKGTGLGLSMVYNIVKQNRGQISVTSKPGKGTAFRIRFPRVASSPSASEKPMSSFGKILLAEKNPGTRNLFRDVLSKMQYEVIPAENDVEALEIYSNQKDTIDWVIWDSRFTDAKEHVPVFRLFDLNPKVRMILTSTDVQASMESLRHQAKEKGAEIQHIKVPATRETLTQSLREVLQQKTA